MVACLKVCEFGNVTCEVDDDTFDQPVADNQMRNVEPEALDTGLDVGDSEDEVFWTQFLRSLKERGLDGVKLVISDAHPGLKNAIEKVFQGSAWQRCKVHLLRNLMAHIPKSHKQVIGATVRTIFVQPDAESTRMLAPNSGKSLRCSKHGWVCSSDLAPPRSLDLAPPVGCVVTESGHSHTKTRTIRTCNNQ